MPEDERHLALWLLIVGGDEGTIERTLAATADRLLGFVDFATRNQLAGYVYFRLRRLRLEHALPAEARTVLRAAYLGQWRHNELLVRELIDIRDRLTAAGIDAMFLKGPLLVQRLHGDVSARAFRDLDLLLRSERDLRAAEGMLVACGYRPRFRLLLGRRTSKLFAHHFAYARDAASVELHWMVQRHFTYRIDYDRLWQRSAQMTFRGRPYRVPDVEGAIVVHTLGVFTDLQVGRLTLKPLLDLYLLLAEAESTIDWAEFFGQRRRERLHAITAFVLDLALEIMGAARDLPLVARFLPEYGRGSADRSQAARHVALHSRRDSISQKLTALRLYDTSLTAAVGWWALSLPWRLVVYQERRAPHRVGRA